MLRCPVSTEADRAGRLVLESVVMPLSPYSFRYSSECEEQLRQTRPFALSKNPPVTVTSMGSLMVPLVMLSIFTRLYPAPNSAGSTSTVCPFSRYMSISPICRPAYHRT